MLLCDKNHGKNVGPKNIGKKNDKLGRLTEVYCNINVLIVNITIHCHNSHINLCTFSLHNIKNTVYEFTKCFSIVDQSGVETR